MENRFFHLNDPTSFLKHNAMLAKGIIYSASLTAEHATELSDITTQYDFFRANDPKERVWERVRLHSFPAMPSRLKGFYCFLSTGDAENAKALWFGGQAREILELRALDSAVLGQFDSRLLDCGEVDWERNAYRYWSGETTSAPFFEVIIHGPIFFPEWEAFTLWSATLKKKVDGYGLG